MSDLLASVTVTFPRAITGDELVAAVKQLSDSGPANGGTSFEMTQSATGGDACVIGQSSKYPYKHLLVAPSREQPEVHTSGTYQQITVMDHYWPVDRIFPVDFEDSEVVDAVRDFAKKLEQHFA